MKKLGRVKDIEDLAKKRKEKNQRYQYTIAICSETGCQASGCSAVISFLQKELKSRGLCNRVRVLATGCHGFCEQGPLMVISPGNIFYCHLKPEDTSEIICETLIKGKMVDRLLYKDPVSGKKIIREEEIPFYRRQDRVLLAQNRLIDPRKIEDYVAQGGYQTLGQILMSMEPEEVIDEIKKSQLRGRGGGGFPTGKKWEHCRAAEGEPKYVICNADEGDPGAYMDRSILEGNPHIVIEGMLIGAFAIGAKHGFIYVRNEYPRAVKYSKMAVHQAEELGLLGSNILGTDFSFDIKIARGGGAFVCGESTALMASLEGKVGEPRPKDIHTTEKGFMDKPSNLNNVETWANVPLVMKRGSSWFASRGTEKSKGTKIFSLTGHVKNTGLVEVSMGTTIREIIYDIGAGPVDGRKIKAVQTGGPSGGCLPESMFDLPVDFEVLNKAGSMVGSGGMVVMDESACMVDVAKYFLNFLLDESCGKCVPCRIGVSRMLEIIEDVTKGQGTVEQLGLLEETAETVRYTSLCALGKTAPNPVMSTLKYFRAEYETHIRDKSCPALVCTELIHYYVDENKCNGCGVCLKACAHSAIAGEKKQTYVINDQKCQKCGICKEQCKFDAIVVE